jgi:hypothetical protein
MNKWWNGASGERYWLESTDRPDLGADLNAPLHDDGGKDNWRYTLLREIAAGDVVLHYHKKKRAIVARSVVVARAIEAEVVWGARGSYAREKGTEPHLRPGLRVPLTSFTQLIEPIPLEEIRLRKPALSEAKKRLELTYGAPLYLPFELSDSRPIRLLQGYIFKMPMMYLIILDIDADVDPGLDLPEEVRTQVLKEGATRQVTVNAYERNPAARSDCIKHWGHSCVVCGFSFGVRYGLLGRNFIHVHHLLPIASIGREYTIDPVQDLRPVCPNCHAMLHRTDPPLSIDELIARIAECDTLSSNLS